VGRHRENEENLIGECECRDDQTVKLDHENTKLRVSLQEALEVQDKQARLMQVRLEQTDDRDRFIRDGYRLPNHG